MAKILLDSCLRNRLPASRYLLGANWFTKLKDVVVILTFFACDDTEMSADCLQGRFAKINVLAVGWLVSQEIRSGPVHVHF